MKSPRWDDELLAEHRAHIQSPRARAAFEELVNQVVAQPLYNGEPAWRGDIRDFRYLDPATGERPFSFITNRSDLLFYVRHTGKPRVQGGLKALRGSFPRVAENPRGEWVLRVGTATEARKLSEFLFNNHGRNASQASRSVSISTRQAHLHTRASNRKRGTRRYWIVSPNVNGTEKNVDLWKRAIQRHRAVFMGWSPSDHAIGRKFATGMKAGDIVLIARRHHNEPDYLGAGVVAERAGRLLVRRELPGDYGWARRLRILRTVAPPEDVPLISVLGHRRALVELHPVRRSAHRLVVDWMERVIRGSAQELSRAQRSGNQLSPPRGTERIKFAAQPQLGQLDYQVRTRAAIHGAERLEAKLVNAYSEWLQRRGRTLTRYSAGRLMCDACEEAKRHLIEAKSSTKREYIRMAVGQLLEYAYLARSRFRNPRRAILLPHRPKLSEMRWLKPLGIDLIWRTGPRFKDNAAGIYCA